MSNWTSVWRGILKPTDRRLRRVIVLVAAVCLPTIVFARDRGPRVEVRCPAPPIPVEIANGRALVYELHITNFDKVPLTLERAEVFGDSEGEVPLQSDDEKQLHTMTVEVGGDSDADSTVIGPGRRAILFLWITVGNQDTLPHVLLHKITFSTKEASSPGVTGGDDAILAAFAVPVSDDPVSVLSSPFAEGIWVAGDGPANNSPHRRSLLAIDGSVHAPERFASDWVKVGPNGDTNHGSKSNSDFWDYDQPLLAVANGTVVRVVDGIAENVPRVQPKEVTLDNIFGNFITLKIGANRFVTYAHLKPGSIKVIVGQRVQRGAVIAHLGNSGQSTAPHLHLQVTNGESGLESEGVPFLFKRYTDYGAGETFELNKHPASHRDLSLPQANEVITFSLNDPHS